jgi:hypothetical protein
MSDTIKFSDLDINNIKFTELKDFDKAPSQKIGLINYKNKNNE